MLWSSWHNHTGDGPRFSYCADADLTPDFYRRSLRSGNWAAFAITDHAFSLALPDDEPWPFQWYHKPARLWEHRAFREDKTAKYLERITKACDGERLFSGLEVEVACDGTLSMESILWPYLHVVIGSIHYLPADAPDKYQAYFDQLDMLLNYPIDIVGHPFRELEKLGPVPQEIIDETMLRTRAANAAVEINAHMPSTQDPQVLARAVANDTRVAFSLDAHHRAELGLHTYFDEVVAASGVTLDQIRLYRPASKTAKPRALFR